MKAGFVQFDPSFGAKQKNFSKIEYLTRTISADLLVLPELFATGYTFVSKEEARNLAEPEGGETANFLQNLAQSIGGTVVGGFAYQRGGKVLNAAMIADGTGVIGIYEKTHLFNKEKLWFSPGETGFQVFDINQWKIGVMVCWDWIFPESARTLALKGAELIAHPANLVLPYCQKAMVTRCLENHVFAITANRYGKETRGEDSFQFGGSSQITGVRGEIISSAPPDQNTVEIVELDLDQAHNKEMTPFNDLWADRRPSFYT